MLGNAAAVDRALTQLTSAVVERLEADGWQRRGFAAWAMAAFTRSMGDGFCATVELSRASFTWPVQRPVELDLQFGAGYEPATALMPILTLDPQVSLLDAPNPADGSAGLELHGQNDVLEVAAKIVQLAQQHGLQFAELYRSVETLDAGLADRAISPVHVEIELRPVLLAAAGQHAAARELVDGYLAQGLEDTEGREYRRFVRQLRRWLDAGGPPIPPVEQTLSRLPPPRSKPQAPGWSDARNRTKGKRAAVEAVRAVARGKSREELTALLVTEYADRDLELAPSEVALAAEMLELDQQPFGRTRRTWRALSMIRMIGSDGVSQVRHGSEPDPDWLRPPERASYPVRTGKGRYAAVSLNPDVHEWLARVAAQAPRRIGPFVIVDLWLTESPGPAGADAGVVVHLGERAVGTLLPAAVREFSRDLTAATFFDEQARVAGRLTPQAASTGPLLEIKLPLE